MDKDVVKYVIIENIVVLIITGAIVVSALLITKSLWSFLGLLLLLFVSIFTHKEGD